MRLQSSKARVRRGAALLGLCASAASVAGCKDATQPEIKVTCDKPGVVTTSRGEIPIAPNGFATVGNRIISGTTCLPFRFVGVSRPALSFSPDGGRLASDTAAAADFARMRSWKANTVRIELAQYFWLKSSRFHDPTYPARVQRVVQQARAAGLYVLLTLQHSDRGDPNYPGDYYVNMHQPMADRAHSIPFWKEVAALYRNDGGIVFELYSEPFPIGGPGGFSNWDIWEKGGLHPADNVYDPRRPFEAAGMQELYDAVRGTGANNLVVVGGTQWGYNLEEVPARRVKGHNIAYATHPWSYEAPGVPPQRQPATWEKEWAFLTSTDPVMITEFGDYNCTLDYPRAVLNEADRRGLSWIAWAWEAPAPGASRQQVDGQPICEFPMLLVEWDGTPSRLGELVKERLATY